MTPPLSKWLLGNPGAGPVEVRLALEGMGPAWLVFWIALAGVFSWVGYRFGAAKIAPGRRRLLAVLRFLFLAGLLVLFSKPVVQLTRNKPVRGTLAVLVDDSASMAIRDQRSAKDDAARARKILGSSPGAAMPSRLELARGLGAGDGLRLWERLYATADLDFLFFGEQAVQAGTLQGGDDGGARTAADRILSGLEARGEATALGDALRSVLDPSRSSRPSAVFVVTDGASNRGLAPLEAVHLAKQGGVPVHVYGVGVEAPNDIMVRELAGPRGVFKQERVEYGVRVRAPSHTGRKLKLVLREEDRVVEEEEISITGPGDNVFKIGYQPAEAGAFQISASIEPQPGEAVETNNSASTRLRVLDDPIPVLYLEQEPRWDFRYLLATLERDKRLHVDCLLYDGDPVAEGEGGRPFIGQFPDSRAKLAAYPVIIIGDVAPDALGDARMEAIRSWVGDLGGAVIFLAGRGSNPVRYASTPLEPLLPVALDSTISSGDWKKASGEPVKLLPTAAGTASPLLRLADGDAQNKKIWSGFPGVDWTARVPSARPNAQVLLEDSQNLGSDGPIPVVVAMNYGLGAVLYIGTDETHRWRTRTGEKYYAAIWNRIIQGFAIDRQLAASPRIQMRPEKNEFRRGEKVHIRGRLLDADFQPLLKPAVPCTLAVKTADGSSLPPKTMSIMPIPGKPGLYEVEIETPVAGRYALATELDGSAPIEFAATEKPPELEDTALDLGGLRNLAEATGGAFFREEDLEKLPGLIASTAATFPVISRIDLAPFVWWLPILLGLVFAEWTLRRLWNVK